MVKMKTSQSTVKSLDLVPMINVVFLLLIFFMLTSSGIQQQKDIDLPDAETSEEISRQTVVVAVHPDGILTFEGRPVEHDRLPGVLEEKFKGVKVRVVEIQADKNIPFEKFGKVIESARTLGEVEFVLTTRSQPSP